MKMCAAFARPGHDVVLVAKHNARRELAGVEDVHGFYGVEPSFAIRRFSRPSVAGGGLFYYRRLDRWMAREAPDLVYSRDPLAAVLAARRGLPVVFEAHGLPAGRLGPALLRRLDRKPSYRRLVVISAALRDAFEREGYLPRAADVVVAHDGADRPPEREPGPDVGNTNGCRVGYVGSFYAGRGTEVVLEVARRLPDLSFHVVGGGRDELEASAGSVPDNVVVHGFLPPGELAAVYARTDVLLMPYQRRVLTASGWEDTSAWMSPLKMFEYMSSGAAIVSSDLPVLREVLKEGTALLVEPDQVEEWVSAVRRLAGDPALRRRLGEAAQETIAREYTWDQRAEAVLRGL